MSICKFKKTTPAGEGTFCKAIQGYCQFLENGYEDGHDCPILEAYPNLEPTESDGSESDGQQN